MDDRDEELLAEELELFEQDGPDLFGSDAPDAPEADDLPEGAAVAAKVTPPAPTLPEPAPTKDAVASPTAVFSRPEAPLALYRRYRPDAFADVIGQEHVTEPLQRALLNNRVNHAYLFSGPRGCGKTTSARILARALNCANGPAPVPCGECQSCRDLARGGPGSIDVIEIDAASHGGVDDARDLRERAFFAPVHSRYKIYIVDEAHMVTTAGFNALLKVVEEPPPHVKFIFATTEPEKVIGTIRSRTHHYPFRLVPPRTLATYLGDLCLAEGVRVEPGVLPLVVRAGAGSVRDSLSVLDQLLGGASEHGVTYPQAAALLGYTPDSLLDEITDAFAAGDARGVFACVDKVIEVGQDPRRFAEDLLRRLRDLIIVAAIPDALGSGLVDVAADQAERLTAQATAMGSGELTRAAEVIAQGLTEMRGTTAPRLHLELMCARVLLPGADVGGRGLHARLDRIERRLGMEGGGPATSGPPAGEPGRDALEASVRRPAHTPSAAPTGSSAAAPPAAGPPAAPRPAAVPNRAPALDTPPWLEQPDAGSVPWAEPEAARPAPGPTVRPASQTPPATQTPPVTPLAPVAGPIASAAPVQTPPARAPRDPSAALTTADLRRLWPDVLTEVKSRRRFTWILLSQNAHVVELVEGVLTLGMSNPGARDSFGRGGSEDVLREAILEVAGVAVQLRPIVDPTDGAPAPAIPAAAPAAPPVATPPPSRPAAADEARRNIRPTRNSPDAPSEEDVEARRDDADLDESDQAHDQLLAKHLGAELIGEE